MGRSILHVSYLRLRWARQASPRVSLTLSQLPHVRFLSPCPPTKGMFNVPLLGLSGTEPPEHWQHTIPLRLNLITLLRNPHPPNPMLNPSGSLDDEIQQKYLTNIVKGVWG
jgi:hypothetical protein